MFGFARESRVRDLEERLQKFERDLRSFALEANDVYEKTRSLQGRVAKRAGLAAPPPPEQPAGPAVPAWLQHMDPVSRRIHEQRSLRVRPGGSNGDKTA